MNNSVHRREQENREKTEGKKESPIEMGDFNP